MLLMAHHHGLPHAHPYVLPQLTPAGSDLGFSVFL